LQQITKKAKDDAKIPEGKYVIYASTPSFIGSHITGYANMVTGMAEQFTVSTGEKKDQVNIVAGWMEPSDMREIKRVAKELGVKIVLFPDTSDVLDAPQTGKHEFYPKGGVTIDELKSTGDSKSTLALGYVSAEPAAIALDKKCKVPFETIEMPIGLSATDRFIMSLSKAGGVSVPDSITAERGRLVDVMADMEQYLYGKKVALFGDPDHLVPLTEFLLDLNMKPMHIVSGTPGMKFDKRMQEILERAPYANFKNGLNADMFLLHQWIKNEPVDLLIGNTYGKYIARDEDIPFVRYGFPILDRVGHSYFPSVGYTGGLRLLEKILTALLDRQDRDALEEKFELVM
jgi:nitrogenase molybdenum-iron protein beta chain